MVCSGRVLIAKNEIVFPTAIVGFALVVVAICRIAELTLVPNISLSQINLLQLTPPFFIAPDDENPHGDPAVNFAGKVSLRSYCACRCAFNYMISNFCLNHSLLCLATLQLLVL
jgi:hypothetical protein